jgi:hypothetical protein
MKKVSLETLISTRLVYKPTAITESVSSSGCAQKPDWSERPQSLFLNMQFNIILPSLPMSSKWSLILRVSNQLFEAYAFRGRHLLATCNDHRIFDYNSNNITGTVKILKLLIVWFSQPNYRFFLSVLSASTISIYLIECWMTSENKTSLVSYQLASTWPITNSQHYLVHCFVPVAWDWPMSWSRSLVNRKCGVHRLCSFFPVEWRASVVLLW